MYRDTDEKRRFILWNISRSVDAPKKGTDTLQPVGSAGTEGSLHRMGIAIDRAFESAVALVANGLLKLRSLRNCVIVGLYVVLAYLAAGQIIEYRSLANAYAAIEKAGGIRPSPSLVRFEFKDPNLAPSTVIALIPHLKAIRPGADIDPSLSPRRVLDFSASPQVDFDTASKLIEELDHTLIIYIWTDGKPRPMRTPDLVRKPVTYQSRNDK